MKLLTLTTPHLVLGQSSILFLLMKFFNIDECLASMPKMNMRHAADPPLC